MGFLTTLTNIVSGNYGKSGLRNIEFNSEEYASRYSPNELIKRIESRSGQISPTTREACCLALLKRDTNLRQVSEVWSGYYGSKRDALDQIINYQRQGAEVLSYTLLEKLKMLEKVYNESGMF